VLPNDPLIGNLTEVQMGWILMNIEHDIKMATEAGRDGRGGYGVSDEEFAEISKELKEKARKERETINNAG